MQKRVFGYVRTTNQRSACASAQSDHGLRFPQIESLDTIEHINREQIPGLDFTHTRDQTEPVRFCTSQ